MPASLRALDLAVMEQRLVLTSVTILYPALAEDLQHPLALAVLELVLVPDPS